MDNSGQGPPKRFKKDDGDPMNPEPSIVVHVRQLSQQATEADLLEALQHFGSISYVTIMPSRRMGLVEFEDLNGARQCVQYSQTHQIYVAGQPALFNYSTSKAIQRIGLESERPNHVVILTIHNAQYPIDVNTIYTICKPHGDVYRIAMIRRNQLQALVEFDSVDSAKKAKQALNGADIYSGCCTLKIEFAKPDHVKVMRNDQEQFDFTLPPDHGGQHMSAAAKMEPRKSLLGGPNSQGSNGFQSGSGGMGMGGGYGQGPPQYSGGPMGGGGGGAGAGGHWGGGRNEGGMYYGGGGGGHMMGGGGPPSMQHQAGGYGASGGGGGGGGGSSDGACVLMVYGVDHERWNCEKLFNLLCLYGNVQKIKFMKSKPDTAMVQMGSYQQMQQAIDCLHNAEVFDTKLALRPSKQTFLQDIREPFELADNSPSFKDYTNSRNQRFLTPQSAARNRIMRPSNLLHWYNAPANMTEETLSTIFEEGGAKAPIKVTVFPVKSERSSSGIVEFEDTKVAIEALMLCNHTAVPSPLGKIPYIVKFAFASGRNIDRERDRDRSSASDAHGGGDDGAGDDGFDDGQ